MALGGGRSVNWSGLCQIMSSEDEQHSLCTTILWFYGPEVVEKAKRKNLEVGSFSLFLKQPGLNTASIALHIWTEMWQSAEMYQSPWMSLNIAECLKSSHSSKNLALIA